MPRLARRRLFQAAASVGVTAAAASLGCAGPVRTRVNPAFVRTPVAAAPGRAYLGWFEPTEPGALCEQVIPAITDLSWLGRGDSVFIKLACNSSEPHPAVTWPDAVPAVVQFLRAHGAGDIYVGDQPGVEHVRLTATERVGSTRETMAHNGLLTAIEQSGGIPHFFDDQGWEGYFQPPSGDFAHHWHQALRVANILREVDHVVYLPRLGAHALSGITCGAKNAVGWLRDDSRLHLHQRGDTFFEQIAEINMFSPLREKLRLVLSLGRGALLNIGPDFGAEYDFEGVVAVGATQLLEHDALATALLLWFDADDHSAFDLYAPYPEDADFWNRELVKEVWGQEGYADYRQLVAFQLGRGLAYDRCLSHLAVLQGHRPPRIAVKTEGARLPPALVAYLRRHADSLFEV